MPALIRSEDVRCGLAADCLGMIGKALVSAPADVAVQSLLDGLRDGTAVLDEDGVVIMVNRAWRAFAGANGGTHDGVGTSYPDVCARADPDPDARVVRAGLRDLLEGAATGFSHVYPCHAPDMERWFEVQAQLLGGHERRYAVVSHRDVTVRHEARRRSRERGVLLDAVGAAIVSVDLDGLITHWSTGAEDLFGWSEADVVGGLAPEITAAQDVVSHLQSRRRSSHGERRGVIRHRDGHEVAVFIRTRAVADEQGLVAGMVGVFVEITDTEVLKQRLRTTGACLEAVMQAMPDGLLVADEAGRALLANEAAEKMLGARGALVGARLPKEIVALAQAGAGHGPETRSDADATLRRPNGTPFSVTYSVAPFSAEDGEKHVVVVFNDISERKEKELRAQRELESLSWIGRIRDALDRDRFVLYAQPIVELSTGATVQHELLVRMLDADGRIVPPGTFLPVAEQHGLIVDIDRWVLERAFTYAADGNAVEVNVSAASLGDPRLPRFVETRMSSLGVDPANVVFEITETALIDNEAVAEAFVERMRALGSAVALDDFGTGYGSFRYLKHLPVSVLKIDQEFVRDLDGDDADANRHVIEAIVRLGRGMGQRTVAEGVESEAALEYLRAAGVDCAQGYLLGRPAPVEATLPIPPRAGDHVRPEGLEADQHIVDLAQAVGDRRQGQADRDQRELVRRGGHSDADVIDIAAAQARHDAWQRDLDDAQRTRDDQQQALDSEHLRLEERAAVPRADLAEAGRRRAHARAARTAAMEGRAAESARRAASGADRTAQAHGEVEGGAG